MPHYDDDNMSQYSQVNVMAAYVSMIRFALDKLELHLDELGDDILFDGMSPFPDDVLGDDSLFAGYTDPWSPDDDLRNADGELSCRCDECCCDDEYDDKRVNRPESKKEYFDWIDDVLRMTRRDPKPRGYRVD